MKNKKGRNKEQFSSEINHASWINPPVYHDDSFDKQVNPNLTVDITNKYEDPQHCSSSNKKVNGSFISRFFHKRNSKAPQSANVFSASSGDKENQTCNNKKKESIQQSQSELYVGKINKRNTNSDPLMLQENQTSFTMDDTVVNKRKSFFPSLSQATNSTVTTTSTASSLRRDTSQPTIGTRRSSMDIGDSSLLQSDTMSSHATFTDDEEVDRSFHNEDPCVEFDMFCGEKNNEKVHQRNSNGGGDKLLPGHKRQKQISSNRNSDPTKHHQQKELSKTKKGDEMTERLERAETILLTRSALSRPFGRTGLPAHLAKLWSVDISLLDFDESRWRWRYCVSVQKEEYGGSFNNYLGGGGGGVLIDGQCLGEEETDIGHERPTIQHEFSLSSSIAAANVTRTLHDFCWLEQAMMDEYHGALILPLLSLAVTGAIDWTTANSMDKEDFQNGEWDPVTRSEEFLDRYLKIEEQGWDLGNSRGKQGSDMEDLCRKKKRPPSVDAKLLADWLSDILNCVRGKGELILNYEGEIKTMQSEAMEMFLYSTKPLPQPTSHKNTTTNCFWRRGSEHFIGNAVTNDASCVGGFCALTDFFSNQLACINLMETCDFDEKKIAAGTVLPSSEDAVSQADFILNKRRDFHLNRPSHFPLWTELYPISPYSKVLEAQWHAISTQRENILRAMYRLRILLEQETLVGAAWKRFAIALSNLFAVEKDIENCKIGEKSKKASSRKLSKSMIEDNLRILARQKMERCVPSLKVLSGMLSAYFADFSIVDPSLRAYANGLLRMSDLDSKESMEGFQSHFLWPLSSFLSNTRGIDEIRSGDASSEIRKELFREKILSQESRMKSSLLQLCNSSNIRVSRMAWKFFKMEASQAGLLRSAAAKLQTKIDNVTSNSSDNNPDESKQTLKDDKKELELVQQCIVLGSQRKFKNIDYTDIEGGSITDDGDCTFDGTIVDAKSPLDETTLELVKDRTGRWDAELVLNIMEAVGVRDADIMVDDTTRDLRQVKKLAFRLRENVNRCAEAVAMLKETLIGKDSHIRNDTIQDVPELMQITLLRERFFSDLSIVFSNKYSDLEKEASQATQNEILSNIGMDTMDSAGWLRTENINEGKDTLLNGRCGEVSKLYRRIRERETKKLLDHFSSGLWEYEHRIERVENFVFLHCVGIQMEKHFSKQRVEALAAWDRKTDITTAINIAKRKKIPDVVEELKNKLTDVENVSHTSVKEAKERHFRSKKLKGELEELASRRFQGLKEDATECVSTLIKLWARHEQSMPKMEKEKLVDVIREIERVVTANKDKIKADGGAHLFAFRGGTANGG